MARRSPTDGVVVGVHQLHLFPADNLHGESRWSYVTEHEDDRWEKHLLPASRPRPQVGDKR